jgi:hypothetical protein
LTTSLRSAQGDKSNFVIPNVSEGKVPIPAPVKTSEADKSDSQLLQYLVQNIQKLI